MTNLNTAEVQGLLDALDDEYKSWSTYSWAMIPLTAEIPDEYFAIIRNTPRMPSKPANSTPDVVFKALGSPVRLALVRKLTEGEHCVCDLVEACGLGWSTTSKHLDVLREAGVVSSDKRGQRIFYRLELACVPDFIACLDGTKARRRLTRPACA